MRTFILNKEATTMDLYDELSARIHMARGFCNVISQDEHISGLVETSGHAASAWGHRELLDEAKALLDELWERMKEKGRAQ